MKNRISVIISARTQFILPKKNFFFILECCGKRWGHQESCRTRDDCCGMLSAQDRVPDSHPLNANRVRSNHPDKRKCPTPHPSPTTSPSKLRSPGFHGKTAGRKDSRETCCLLDGLRLVGVASESGKTCVLGRSHMLGASTCTHSIISPKTPPSLKSRDCYIRWPGGGQEFIHSLVLPFDGYSLSPCLLCVKQALYLLPSHILLTKPGAVPTHVGLASGKRVPGEMETRRSIIKDRRGRGRDRRS